MPSILAHPAVAGAFAPWLSRRRIPWGLLLAGAICAIVPDADVVGERFGVRYESMYGHRGLTHSLFFAACLGAILTAAMPRMRAAVGSVRMFVLFFLCAASHGALDAFTNGGQGVAFLAPFSDARWFAPWRPIAVSPLSVSAFFDGRAPRILASELRWVLAPCAVVGLAGLARRYVGRRTLARSSGLAALVVLSWALAGPAGAETLVVRAGHLVDVAHGRVLADQAVRIADGRVVSVTPFAASAAKGARVVDWSKWWVLPGLIDLHTHLVGDIQSSDPAAPLKSTAAADALLGAQHAAATLRAGFTTVRDVGTYRAFVDIALRDAIAAGRVPGPRMFVAGAYVTIAGGGGEVTGLPPGTVVPDEFRRGVANSEPEVRQRVRELLDGGADFIKVIATGAVLTAGTEPGRSEYTESQIRAAVEEAAARGTFVAAHAHGAEGIKRAVRAGVRTVEHASYLDDEGIALMLEHGTCLVADVYNGDYIDAVGTRDHWPEETLRKNRETTQTQRDGFAKAVKAGVRAAFGTDAGVYPHGENARHLSYMVRNGMTPMQAIQAATIVSARCLDRERELGSIEPGKRADLIAVAGDPLADVERLRTIAAVMKDGAVVPLNAR